jgi:hypothetical protein
LKSLELVLAFQPYRLGVCWGESTRIASRNRIGKHTGRRGLRNEGCLDGTYCDCHLDTHKDQSTVVAYLCEACTNRLQDQNPAQGDVYFDRICLVVVGVIWRCQTKNSLVVDEAFVYHVEMFDFGALGESLAPEI